ncbi:hypothetical protein CJ030_MR1G027069 [Morella rubra]|uniref:PWWP domain-containing protein n=1 Tax=Morella rubra TaxID=262757 RepID=A0A6A1WME4_9ROSI|nr:hypothetical protein CJ030_MR1G027069 [Morella rubra]
MQRGEIVWARVFLPQKWWPGLVLRTDALGVLVSFFHVEPPSYFLESEVRPFENNFRSLRCSTSGALLDRALEFFGRRNLSSLKCPCQRKNGGPRVTEASATSFQAVGVLEFVRGVAVSPWVEEADFVDAVRALAQVQAFRSYSSGQQRLMYNRHHKRDVLELEHEYQLLFEEGEVKLAAGVGISEHQPDNSSQVQIKQQKAQLVNEMLVNLQCLALDPFDQIRKCSSNLEQNVLRFRSLSFHNIPDIHLKKCLQPKSTEAHFSHPGYIKSKLSANDDEKQGNGEIFCSSVSCIGPSVSYMGLKRKLDQPSISECSFKLQKTMPFFSITGIRASLQIDKTGSKTMASDAFISGPVLSDPYFRICMTMLSFQLEGSDHYLKKKQRSGYEIELFHPSFPFSPLNLKIKHQSSTRSQSLVDGVQKMLDISLLEEASHPDAVVEIRKLRKPEKNDVSQSDARACISCIKRQEPGKHLHVWKDNGFQDESVKDDCNLSALQPFAGHTNSTEDSTLANKKCMLQSDGISNIITMVPGDVGAMSIRSNEAPSDNVAFEDSFKKGRELYRPVTSDVSFELQRGRQFETLSASASLHMEFPRDFKLPSKQELVKVFSPFGTVDTVRTRISSSTGAAQVVFLHPTDALAAYQYAKKRRALFGEANIRFWLDPLEHRRRGTEFSVPCPSSTGKPMNVKSCQPSFKPQRIGRLEALATFSASTSLHMKFPKDFKLPSKEELVKKFSPFGKVDYIGTKVFSCTGAAQVVFSKPIDAIAAYQYAKKKGVLFGGANIRYWLDPLEHRRRGTKFSALSPSLTGKPVNLKSCIKKPRPPDMRDKKKPYKVRFTIET